MEYEKNEQVIFVKDLLFAVLYQWRRILISALAFLIVLGGLAAVLEYQKATAVVPEATVKKEMAAYEEKKESLQKDIEQIKVNLARQKAYVENSVLMAADPYNTYHADFVLMVDTAEETGKASAILRAYLLYLNSKALYDEMQNVLNIGAPYCSELIKTERDAQHPQSVLVTITHGKEDAAKQLLSLVVNHLQSARPAITSSLGAHDMGIVVNEAVSVVDTNVEKVQKNSTEYLATLEGNLETQTKALEALTPPTFEGTFSVKKVVLFAVLGGCLGAFFVVCFACGMHILGGKVYSARTLRNKTGLNSLGCMLESPGKNPVDRWLMKLEGRVTDPDQAQVVLSTVYNYCSGGKKVMVAGDCEQAAITVADALKKMGVQVVAAGNLLKNADVVAQLPACDEVLLAERCGVSRYENVMQCLALADDQKKPVMGFVLMER